MSKTIRKRAARRSIDRHGKEVTLVNKSDGGNEDYPGGYSDTTNSPHTIVARAYSSSQGQPERTEQVSGEGDFKRIFIAKDNASGVDNINDGAGPGASEITEAGNTWIVTFVDSQDNGVIRIECENK